MQVDSAWSSGDYEAARRNANIAKILNIVGFSVGTVVWVIAVTIIIISIAVNMPSVRNRYYSSYSSSYYH